MEILGILRSDDEGGLCDMYQHCEHGFEETRAAAKIVEILRGLGIEVHENMGRPAWRDLPLIYGKWGSVASRFIMLA